MVEGKLEILPLPKFQIYIFFIFITIAKYANKRIFKLHFCLFCISSFVVRRLWQYHQAVINLIVRLSVQNRIILNTPTYT